MLGLRKQNVLVSFWVLRGRRGCVRAVFDLKYARDAVAAHAMLCEKRVEGGASVCSCGELVRVACGSRDAVALHSCQGKGEKG